MEVQDRYSRLKVRRSCNTTHMISISLIAAIHASPANLPYPAMSHIAEVVVVAIASVLILRGPRIATS